MRPAYRRSMMQVFFVCRLSEIFQRKTKEPHDNFFWALDVHAGFIDFWPTLKTTVKAPPPQKKKKKKKKSKNQ